MIQTSGWDKINSLEILFHGLNTCNKSPKIKLFRVSKAIQWTGLDPWVGPFWLMGHMFDNFVKRLYCGFWKRYYWFCIKLWSASQCFQQDFEVITSKKHHFIHKGDAEIRRVTSCMEYTTSAAAIKMLAHQDLLMPSDYYIHLHLMSAVIIWILSAVKSPNTNQAWTGVALLCHSNVKVITLLLYMGSSGHQ